MSKMHSEKFVRAIEQRLYDANDKNDKLFAENKRLRDALSDKNECLDTIRGLSGMFLSMMGTDQEAPWVRTMASIEGQAERGLKEMT